MKTITVASRTKLALLLCVTGFLMFVPPQARANEDKDPPTRVARISYVDGSVSLQPGGQGDWGSAVRNRPMTIGDKIWVDKDSRAELQTGQAAFHLGSMTALSFLNLDQGITQVRLAEGSLNFRVRELRQGDVYEVDAPNLAFTVRQAGAFRIDVSEAGDSSRVTVLRGEGEITAGGTNYDVHGGELAEFNGVENPTYSVTHASGLDGLDRWAEERDLKEDRSVSGRYVSRDMPGYDDLDDYGTWRDEPEYGHVWYPAAVAPGWAPYSYGYWGWVDPWGWSWVDYDPWGFAPFHYGRWAYIGGAWGWCPGPFYGPPVYGPAFVGFLGGGWGFGFGFGVGWFPLGWGEPFFPWFPCSHNFVTVINVHNTVINNVNVFNNTNVHNVNFANAHNVNAVTVASRSAFVNGQPINRGAQHLSASALNGAKVTNSVGLKPTQRSALGSANIKSNVARPPAAVQNRQVIARTTPAPAASHSPVRAINTTAANAGRAGNSQVNGAASANGHAGNSPVNGAASANGRASNSSVNGSARVNGGVANRPSNAPSNSAMTPRQRELSQNRPPSAMPNSNHSSSTSGHFGNAPGNSATTPSQNRPPSAMPNSNHSSSPSGHFGNAPGSSVTPRQPGPSQNRPPSAMLNSGRSVNSPAGNNSAQRPGSNSRAWDAQGDVTDRGRAPQGFGSSNGPANAPQTSARVTNDRPPWANGGAQRGSTSSPSPSRPSAPNYNNNRPSYSNSGRSYEPPQRSSSSPSYGNRGYAQQPSYSPPRSYSEPRTYSPPSRSYPAPSRSYSAPSPSYGGGGYSGGGGSHGGGSYGGGGSHGGGSYGGGGGYSGGGSHGGGSYGGGGYSGGGSHGGGGGGGSHSGGGGGGGSHGGGGGRPH